MTGIDSQGASVELVASVSHPDKQTILLQWAEGYDAALFRLNDETLIAVGDGVDTHTFKVALAPGEVVLSFRRDDSERTLTIKIA
jgi:hypothetical protein